jgi:probable F420-dependent oxidoreductase
VQVAVGVNLVPVPIAEQSAAAVYAEELGYESVWIGEHVLVPAIPSGAPPSAATPFPPTRPWLEPLTQIAYLAAITSRLRLATGVLVLPLRDPFVTARAVATADLLSGGRLILGVGAGWLADEFAVTGHAFEDRASVTAETMALMTALFADGLVEHHGPRWDVAGAYFEPKPVQRPRPPLLGGGTSPAALRRAAELADGWYGPLSTPDEAVEMLGRLERLRGDRPPLEITAGTPRDVDLDAYAAVGVARVVVTPWQDASDWRAGLEQAATHFGLAPPVS